jgi:hypothetical protein
MGLPVLRALSLCTCCRHYPGAATGASISPTHPSRISLPRKGCRVGLRIVLFEDCSAFTRVTACTLALSPMRDTHSEGFSHFVTSMTAPVASGWSGCRVGLAPTGKRRLVTAHTQLGHSPPSITALRKAHSITSSAMESSPDGMVRPSAFAVLRLMTKSNLVDCITGKSDGFSPLSTRPVINTDLAKGFRS